MKSTTGIFLDHRWDGWYYCSGLGR